MTMVPDDYQLPTKTIKEQWLEDNPGKTDADFWQAMKGESVTQAQVDAAAKAYLQANPPKDGANATPEQIASAVAAYLKANPPKDGASVTDAQVASAVSAYLKANPPKDGANATDAQVSTAVSAYLKANPPKDGSNATDAQVASAVSAYLKASPPASGKDGIVPFYVGGALQAGVQKHSFDTTTDASGNWSVDISAAKFTKILEVVGQVWKDTTSAVELADIKFRTRSVTKIAGSVTKGTKITSVLITAGADTAVKAEAGLPVTITVTGTV